VRLWRGSCVMRAACSVFRQREVTCFNHGSVVRQYARRTRAEEARHGGLCVRLRGDVVQRPVRLRTVMPVRHRAKRFYDLAGVIPAASGCPRVAEKGSASHARPERPRDERQRGRGTRRFTGMRLNHAIDPSSCMLMFNRRRRHPVAAVLFIVPGMLRPAVRR